MRQFEQFYRDNLAGVRRFLWARCGDRGMADEVANDTFFTAWVRWDVVQTHPKPVAWVYTTANRKLSEARRRASRCLLFDVWQEGDGVEPNQIVIETTAVIDQIFAYLEPIERQAVLLAAWGWTEREGAAILGITLHSYKTHKRVGIRKARQARIRLGLDEGDHQ